MLPTPPAAIALLRWTAAALLLGCSLPHASQGAGAADGDKGRLAEVLAAWEKVRRADRPTHFRLTGKIKDCSFGGQETFGGEVFAQGGEPFRADVQDSRGKPDWTLLAVKGKTCVYFFKSKTVWVGPTPPELRGEKGPARNGFVDTLVADSAEQEAWLLRGLPPSDFSKRFRVRLEKEDASWIYLGFHPRKRSGGRPDQEWQIVLERKTYRLRRVWTQMPNGNTEQVDFEYVDAEALPATTWEPPLRKAPEAWVEVDWTEVAAGPPAMPPQGGKGKDR